MRNRTASLSWIGGLAVAVAATSFMASAPAEAAGRNCRSEQKVTYKRICSNRNTHRTNRTWWHTNGFLPFRCFRRKFTKTLLICDLPPAAPPRAPKPGRPPIKLN